MVLDLEDLPFAEGGQILVKRALSSMTREDAVHVVGSDPHLQLHLRHWCRLKGHLFDVEGTGIRVRRCTDEDPKWHASQNSGAAGDPGEHAQATWGLAGRSATVEAGMPAFDFDIVTKEDCWADEAKLLYAQALASQWDPNQVIDWDQDFELPPAIEDAVVQVMTFLIENETAALVIPSRFASRIHPHFREIIQLLAIQVADEARHLEVFTRRALLKRKSLARSTVGGQTSLKTLVDEVDFSLASLLLSVMGEGSFLSLLAFLHQHGPDPITRQITKLAAQDEARHVAFGVAHLAHQAKIDPKHLDRFAGAIENRHDALAQTSGLNEDVFEALLVLAAGSFEVSAMRRASGLVRELLDTMHQGRLLRLKRIGFSEKRAEALAALHTRNFM